MITLLLVLVAGIAVLGAGEAVRGQCRRMLARPAVISAEQASGVGFAAVESR